MLLMAGMPAISCIFCPENTFKAVIPAGCKPESRVSREDGNLFPYSGFPLNRLRE